MFIKLIVLSYSDVLLSNFLPRLVAITHSQSLTIVLKRDRIIEQIFFNNQANCNKWISFVIGQLKGTNAILLIDSSIRLSRITKKTVKWAQKTCKMLAQLGSDALPCQNAELKVSSTYPVELFFVARNVFLNFWKTRLENIPIVTLCITLLLLQTSLLVSIVRERNWNIVCDHIL